MKTRFLIAALACLAAGAAQAHDIVLVPHAQGLTVRYGHPQDWLPVDGEKLLELQLLGADGTTVERHGALKARGLNMELAGVKAPVLAAARYDNGLWVQTATAKADGKPEWRNASRFMLPDAASLMLSVKFAKAFAAGPTDDTLYQRRVGHLLELVPQKNPLALKAGDALPVLVLFNGQPLAGAGIEVSDMVTKLPEDKIKRYVSGSDGIALVTLRPRGVNMLGLDLERPNDAALPGGAQAAPADKVLMVATYTFVR